MQVSKIYRSLEIVALASTLIPVSPLKTINDEYITLNLRVTFNVLGNINAVAPLVQSNRQLLIPIVPIVPSNVRLPLFKNAPSLITKFE